MIFFKHIYKKVPFIIVLFAGITASASTLFYKNPTYFRFKEDLIVQAKSIENKKNDQKDFEHVKNIATVFTSKIIIMYPNLLDQIVKEYPTYPPLTKHIILQSLINAHKNKEANDLSQGNFKSSDKNIADYVDKAEFIIKNKKEFSEADLMHNSALADYYWASYFTTGDEKYVKKMVKFVHEWTPEMQKFAWEMLNRDFIKAARKIGTTTQGAEENDHSQYKDIYERLNKSRLGSITQLKSLYVILWSLDRNAKQIPEVKIILSSYTK